LPPDLLAELRLPSKCCLLTVSARLCVLTFTQGHYSFGKGPHTYTSPAQQLDHQSGLVTLVTLGYFHDIVVCMLLFYLNFISLYATCGDGLCIHTFLESSSAPCLGCSDCEPYLKPRSGRGSCASVVFARKLHCWFGTRTGIHWVGWPGTTNRCCSGLDRIRIQQQW
jgi:hypothetical protein